MISRLMPVFWTVGLVSWAAPPGDAPSGATGAEASAPWPVPEPDTTDMQPAVAQRITEVREEVIAHRRSVAAWSRLGAVCDAHHLFDCAETAYERARTLAPDDFRWPYLLAIVRMRSAPAAKEVETLMRHAIEMAPAYAPGHFHLGFILAKQGDRDGAAEEYRRAIELNPDLALAHRNLGQLLLARGDTEAAIDALERAARLNPKDGGVFAALAQAYGRAGDRDKARAMAETGRPLRPVSTMEDPIRAQVLAEAVNMAAIKRRIMGHLRNRDFEAAIPLLELVNEFRPDDVGVLRALGRAHRALGRPDLAEKYMVQALDAEPGLVELRAALAALLANDGRHPEAIEQYERVVRDAPARTSSRLALAGLLVRENRFREAADQFRQAARQGPLAVDSQLLFGEALLRSDDLPAAVEQLKAVTEAEPQNAEAHFLLAKSYEGLGDAKKADAHLRRAAAIERGRHVQDGP